jgi:hypothetical protein
MKVCVKSYADASRAPETTSDTEISWEDLVLSAITIGRRQPADLLPHGQFSILEMIYRIALIAANLREQLINGIPRFAPSPAFKALDPSEKGAVTYFLAMACAGVMARNELDAPWHMHLDVYTNPNNPYGFVLPASLRSTGVRPDLIGQTNEGDWCILEAKGRTNAADENLRKKAKAQTQSVSQVDGVAPRYRYGTCAALGSGSLVIDWIDPIDAAKDATPLDLNPDVFALASYAPFIHAFRERDIVKSDDFPTISLPETDVQIGIHRPIYSFLHDRFADQEDGQFVARPDMSVNARNSLADLLNEIPTTINHSGGITVQLGDSWSRLRIDEPT